MKRIKFDGSGDRQVLVGLITDTAFNEAVREYITPEGLFHGNDPYNRIAKWCAKYYDRYDRAPGRHISGIFDRWASADDRSEEEVRDMARMIKYAESQTNGERFETDYLLGVAEERLNHHYEQRIADTLALGDAGQRAAVLGAYTPIELLGSDNDWDEDDTTGPRMEKIPEPLFGWDDVALDGFWGNTLHRNAFVAMLGGEKAGKTWWLIEIAYRAAMAGLLVHFFEVGDMTAPEVMERFVCRHMGRALTVSGQRSPISIESPRVAEKVEDLPIVEYDPAIEKQNEIVGTKFDRARDHMKERMRKAGGGLRLSYWGNDEATINTVSHRMRTVARRKRRMPDMVIIDYADLLSPLNSGEDSRHQIHRTWKRMRALSHAGPCVVTATQAAATSYFKDWLDKQDYSEDKRKASHVTAMVGINRGEVEAEAGLARLNYLYRRRGSVSPKVTVGQALGIGRPCTCAVLFPQDDRLSTRTETTAAPTGVRGIG